MWNRKINVYFLTNQGVYLGAYIKKIIVPRKKVKENKMNRIMSNPTITWRHLLTMSSCFLLFLWLVKSSWQSCWCFILIISVSAIFSIILSLALGLQKEDVGILVNNWRILPGGELNDSVWYKRLANTDHKVLAAMMLMYKNNKRAERRKFPLSYVDQWMNYVKIQ